MAINNQEAITTALSALKAQGFNVDHELSVMPIIVAAITNAILDQIKQNAKANVTSGSSAGMHPII